MGINEMVTPSIRNINTGKAWGFSKVIQFCTRDFWSHTSRSTGFSDLGIKPNRRLITKKKGNFLQVRGYPILQYCLVVSETGHTPSSHQLKLKARQAIDRVDQLHNT